MNDDAVVKVISRLTVDISLAKTNLEELAKETGLTTKQIKKYAKEIEQCYRELAKAEAAEGRRIKQEEAMWRQLQRQKEAEARAEERRMRQEIRMWEQQEAARQRAAERRLRAEQLAARIAEQQRQRAIREAERAAKQAAQEEARKARLLAQEQKRAAIEAARARREDEAATIGLANLSAQVAALQSRIKLENISSTTLREQVKQHAEAVQKLREEVGLAERLTAEQKERLKQLQMQQKILSAQVSEASALQRATISGQLTSMAARRASWFITGSLMFGLSAGLRQVISDVSDVEMRMITLARIMEDPLFTIQKMRTALFGLAQEFGFTFQEVQDIALRWAQAGYDMAEALELTRASLLALNTAELDAEEATQSLIGVLSQWGMEASDLTLVIDKINKVADEFAVTSQDLVDGLLRSSGAARAANLTFDETVALLTVMREASGRTGKEVGNALNSILAYIQRDKSIKTLLEAGIPVYADEAGTRLRNVFDIIADIAANWNRLEEQGFARALMEEAEAAGLFSEEVAAAANALEEWSDLERRDILSAGAGVYRRNYFLALLNNFEQVKDVLDTLAIAAGYSMRENERTMGAFQKQLQSLRAELQELAYSLAAESGPLDLLKMLVRLLREGVDAFNQLPQPIKTAIMWISVAGTSIALLNSALKLTAGTTIPEVLKAMGGWRGVVTRIRGEIASVVAALGGIGPAVAKLAPVVALMSALAYGIYKATQYANRYHNAFKQLTDKHAEAMQTYEAELKNIATNIELLQKLGDEYRKLEKDRQEALAAGDQDKANAAYDRQVAILAEVEDALGRVVAARLKEAQFSEQAANEIIAQEKEKAKAIRQRIEEELAAYREGLRQQREDILKALDETERAMLGQFNGFLDAITTTFRHLPFWDAIKFGWESVLASVKVLFYSIMEEMANQAEELIETIAEGLRTTPWEPLQNLGWRLSATVGERLRGFEAAMISRRSQTVSGLNERREELWQARQQELRKLLNEINQELVGSYGGGATARERQPGSFGPGDAEKLVNRIRSVVDAIVAEVEAIGLLDKALERHMNLLEQRIAYYTREGASLEELQQADRDRAELMDLLRQRQEMLHRQAEAARQAYADLEQQIRSTFGQVFDLSTPEGRAGYFALSDEQQQAYDALADAMERMLDVAAKNGAEWWRIQRQLNELAQENNAVSVVTLRILEETQRQYKEGALTLEDYARVLKVLSDQADLSSEALKALRDAEREVKQERFDTALANLEDLYESGYIDLRQYIEGLRGLRDEAMFSKDAMERLNGELEKAIREYLSGQVEAAFTERIEAIEAEIKKVNDELKQTVDNLDRIFEGFDRVTRQMDRAATRTNLLTAYNAFIGRPTRYSEPSAASIRNLAREAISGFGLSDLSALGVLSPEEFAEAISRDLDILRDASTKAKRLTDQVSGYYSQRLREIEQELKAVDEWYEARIAELQRQLDALDAEEKAAERAKAEEEYNKRIQALMEEREWVLLQNEEDAAFRIAAIDAQLAKERAAWSEQLTKWQREDQRERIRNEMEELQRRRDAIRRDLEEQREALREQQQMMSDLLNAVLEYINSEIEARREATEDYKAQLQAQAEARVQDLEDTKAWLEEKRAAFDEHWANVLADMAARDPQFFARGQALVDNIIAGIESRKADLEAAIDELNSILSRVRSGVSIDLPSLTVGGGTVYGMAEGAYVKGGKGGVLALIGEKAHDEIVFPVPKITPIMADAMRQVMATSSGLLGDLPRAVASAVQKALANTSFYGAFDITLPDGTVERQVIRVFSGLTPHVRTS